MSTTFEQLQARRVESLVRSFPDLAITLGARQHGRGLPSGHRDAIEERLKFYEDWAQELRGLPEGALSPEESFERELFYGQLALFTYVQRDLARWRHNPDPFEGLGTLFFCMLLGAYDTEAQRFEHILAALEDTPRYLLEFRTRIASPDPWWQRLARDVAAGMPTLFSSISQAAATRVGGELAERIARGAARASEAAEEHKRWVEGLEPGPEGQWHLSDERFQTLMRLKGLPFSTDELRHIGVVMLSQTHRRRKRLAAEILPGATPHQVNEWLNAQAPATFEEGLAGVRSAVDEARAFIAERGLASVFDREELVVVETPAFFVPLVPFAAIIPAARMDKVQRGIYLVTRGAGGDLSDLAYGRLAGVACHEAYPGHHLQLATANVKASAVRTGVFGGLFEDGVSAWGVDLVEGWAHYCEDMMPDAGFRDTPSTRFVQANDQLWRACRIVIDVELSRGKMGCEEAVHLLIRETDMPESAARAEVDRYTTSPGYQLCYLTGKVMLEALREEARSAMGEGYSPRAFHDFILSAGNMPISALRQLLWQRHGQKVPDHPLVNVHALEA